MSIICRDPQFTLDRSGIDPLMIVNPLDQQLCELVARVLIRHYPGHEWLVEADCRKGFIDIRNISLDGAMGCRIPMNGPATSSELEKIAKNYGGEILERYHVSRGALKQDEIDMLSTDFGGRRKADV